MGFLDGLFETKAAVKDSGAIARATGGSNVATSGAYAVGGQWDVEHAVTRGYERVMWVFRCVDAIASEQANIPIVVREGDRLTGKIVEYTDVNRLLNDRPNTYEDAWQFRYRLSSQLLLSRRGAFIEVIPSRSGGYAQLHLLPPGRVEPIPGEIQKDGSRNFVDGYKVQRSDWETETLPPERVIWIKAKTHPMDPYQQMTPLVAAGLAIETDFLARMFNRNFLMNDGRPGGIVTIKGQLNNEDAAEVKRRFMGGYMTAGRTTVLEADGIDYADLAATPRDIQWAEMLTGNKNDILIAFGTPESVLGNASGRTFDNADAEYETWMTGTVVNHCNAVTRPLDLLTGSITDDNRVVHDFSTVAVLQRHENNRRTMKMGEFAAGVCTLDEVLIEMGQDPLDLPATRVYYLPNGLIVGSLEDAQAVTSWPRLAPMPPPGSPAAMLGMGAPTAPTAPDDTSGRSQLGAGVASRAWELAAVKTDKPTETKTAEVVSVNDPHNEQRKALEGFIEGTLSLWSDRQGEVVLDRLMHTKVRKGTRHWDGDPGTKALDTGYVVDDRWGDELLKTLGTRIKKAARQEAAAVAEDVRRTGLLEVLRRTGATKGDGTPLAQMVGNTRQFTEKVTQPVMDIISEAAQNMNNRVAKKIKEMDEAGATMDQIKSEVQSMMSTRSPWHKQLATHLTTTAIEAAKAGVYEQAGDWIEKTWNAHEDERTRPSHARANGQVRKVSKPFRVGGAKMDHTGDPNGPVGERINCRCWTSYRIVTPPRTGGVF